MHESKGSMQYNIVTINFHNHRAAVAISLLKFPYDSSEFAATIVKHLTQSLAHEYAE